MYPEGASIKEVATICHTFVDEENAPKVVRTEERIE